MPLLQFVLCASLCLLLVLCDRFVTCRKSKVLPVPQLVSPGSWSHKPDIWDCAAVLVDKPQTWTSFDVCGKLKGVLKVKKASQLCRTLYSSHLPACIHQHCALFLPYPCYHSCAVGIKAQRQLVESLLESSLYWQRLSQQLSVPGLAHTRSCMAGCMPVQSANVL